MMCCVALLGLLWLAWPEGASSLTSTIAYTKMALSEAPQVPEVIKTGVSNQVHCAILCKMDKDEGNWCNAAVYDPTSNTCKLLVMTTDGVSRDLAEGAEAMVDFAGLLLPPGQSLRSYLALKGLAPHSPTNNGILFKLMAVGQSGWPAAAARHAAVEPMPKPGPAPSQRRLTEELPVRDRRLKTSPATRRPAPSLV